MRRNSRGWRGLTSFVFIAAVVGLAIWAGRLTPVDVAGQNQLSSPTSSLTLPQVIVDKTTTTPSVTKAAADYDLVFLMTSGGVNQIVIVNPATQKRQVMYTDKDETLKLKLIGNMTATGSEVIALMGEATQDFGGSLWAIKLDGSGLATRLIADFTAPWPPVFSPDGTHIAYVTFSNAEADYGFSLILANRDGTAKKILVRDNLPLTQPIFSPSGQQLAYVRQTTDPAGGGEILLLSTNGGSPEKRASFTNRVPYDLTWASDDSLAFVDGPGQQGDLFELTKDSNEPKRLSALAGQESRPAYAPDGQSLAFTQIQGTTGTLYIFDRVQNQAQSLGSAKIVVGWRQRSTS